LCHNTRLTDDDTGTDSNAVSLIVNNVDPVITALASDATFADKAEEGETVTVSGAFTDVGTLDTYIASIDWGTAAYRRRQSSSRLAGTASVPVTLTPRVGCTA
jgi:hypothetical protein